MLLKSAAVASLARPPAAAMPLQMPVIAAWIASYAARLAASVVKPTVSECGTGLFDCRSSQCVWWMSLGIWE
jgi:hypothetical protein